MDQTNVDKEEKGAIAGSSADAVASGVTTGIVLGSTSSPENDLTRVLDSSQEEVASTSAQNENPKDKGLEAQNPVGNDHNGVDDANNMVVEDGNGDNQRVVGGEIASTQSVRRTRQRNPRPQAVPNHPLHASPGYAPYPPHTCHPVCETCQSPMLPVLEVLFQQNVTLTSQKRFLEQEVSKSRAKIIKHGQNVDNFEKILNETAEKLQQAVHDNTELDRTLAYFRQELAERKEKIEKLKEEIKLLNKKCGLFEDAYQMENAIAASLKDLPQHMEQVTEMIDNILKENRALKAENEELREQLEEEKRAREAQNEELRDQNQSLRVVTENATREDELYVHRMTQIECCINEEVRKLREAYIDKASDYWYGESKRNLWSRFEENKKIVIF